MKLLFVGNGKGSWQIRGEQLGHALGARVTTAPNPDDWKWADVCVLVKNYGARYARAAQQANVPIVWDALDFWSQPRDNQANETEARQLLDAQIRVIKPALVVCATRAMAEACGGVYLQHHAWPGLEPAPARERISVVGYEGNALYLGAWRKVLEQACAERGWTFVINPPDLRQVDLLVALRDGPWDGWICRSWKSGVKVVNAIAAGRPLITQPTSAALEIGMPGRFADSVAEVLADLDYWASNPAKRMLYPDRCRSEHQPYRLSAVAAKYQQILDGVEARCAA